MDTEGFDTKPVRKVCSRIGLGLCVITLAATVLQLLWVYVPRAIWGEDNWFTGTSTGVWIGSFVPMYLIAFPAGLLLMRRLPSETPRDSKLGAGNFWVFLLIGFFLMYCGSIVGNLLSMLLSGGTAENALTEYAMDTNPIKVLFMVILAPLIEEYVFRKQIIDRTAKYGEKMAVFLSALTFGLIHQNLYQFFYAFLLGWVFGYIYIRTGRLRYTVIMHAIVNFMGSVVSTYVLSAAEKIAALDLTAPEEELLAQYSRLLPELLLLMLYVMVIFGAFIAGLVLLIIKCRRLVWNPAREQLPKGTLLRSVYLNVGMVALILLCLFFMVLALLS